MPGVGVVCGQVKSCYKLLYRLVPAIQPVKSCRIFKIGVNMPLPDFVIWSGAACAELVEAKPSLPFVHLRHQRKINFPPLKGNVQFFS